MASGYLVAIVYDGRTAVGMAREAAFDLLLDIGLPGIDGVSVLRELRNRRERLPVILTFAREEPPGHGADDFLLKPFSLADLLAVVRKAISERCCRTPSTVSTSSVAPAGGPASARWRMSRRRTAAQCHPS